ncbi:LLM class flavin-dependent oxidoreductase [Flavipsychrobacter stenotrophus]|uniref:LLM class flavin-dependent oxidoreductase n=1 Tax=Flavipsychrobacter stenotrophus TaxID=2077091 RepID=A0A2S7SRU6_9BACT|nr:LLM class flavin-dependent oxidoreductase [Flavipsychrobacter stenotrophus]PQJ09629.1 LLM class flavin-dependent oxidoreductase [Flavipsychrobacter stenotrophus]
MELGISTFGEIPIEHISGGAVNSQKRIDELLQEAKLADEIGIDVYALGEHHRPDYVISSPEMVLAAAAAITKRIKLTSAVTVLSSADPVRVYQNFATLDLISKGRAEIMAGRGSFIESFPLFGYDLDDYDELFTEKLELLLNINANEVVSSKGNHRASIGGRGVYPRPYQQQLPIWLAVGGTPQSVVRAGTLNIPLTIAILGGQPVQYVQLTDLYRKAAAKAGHDADHLQLAINQHMYIADDSQQAADEFWPIYSGVMNRVGKERGWSPMSREQFEYLRMPGGPLLVGTAQEVADKIIAEHKLFNNTRFLAQTISGDIAHEKLLHSIELFGTKVAPMVRAAIK